MPFQFLLESLATQVAPESAEVYIWPPPTVAASLVPSAEEVTDTHNLFDSRGVQVAPESVETYN
jgi:hypothetical protein